MELPIINLKRQEVGKFKLDSDVFDGKVNRSLLHQAVVIYLANQRKGLASTKTRGEVRGGGRKPWRQKGTGRARVGSLRSPLWRGGGVVFGPKPRSFHKKLPRKMNLNALKSALNARLKDNEIILLEKLEINSFKTKEFFNILKSLKLEKEKVKFIVDKLENNIKLSSRNIRQVEVITAATLNTYKTLEGKKLIFLPQALREVENRIKKYL